MPPLAAGALASAALVAGAAAGVRWRLPETVVAVLLGLAAGALMAAVAFELAQPALAAGGALPTLLGFTAGAVTFITVDSWLDRRSDPSTDPQGRGPSTDPQGRGPSTDPQGRGPSNDPQGRGPGSPEPGTAVRSRGGRRLGLVLVAAVVLDGVPENLALGMQGTGSGITLLAAIALSNFPEAFVGATLATRSGMHRRSVLLVWAAAGVLLTAAAGLGGLVPNGAGDGADGTVAALPLAFAAGAVVTSISDTLLPNAARRGSPWSALATAVGFLAAVTMAVG